MSAAEAAQAVRRAAGLFRLEERGLIEVRGSDRVRWLDGQLTHQVTGLDAAGPRSGCYALLLTPQGRIVADLHVLSRPEAFWLEMERAGIPAALERLDKFLVADDVDLLECSDDFVRLGIEGPRTRAVLAAALGGEFEVAPDAAAALTLAGTTCVGAGYGWSGEDAVQLFVPSAAAAAVEAALHQAGTEAGLVVGSADVLELLRVEAGRPRLGRELGEDVLPAEARLLERAVSFTKGCYTGQEVVARMHSRGQVKHLLVGLQVEGDAPPSAGAPVTVGGQRVGEVTSAARSAQAGAIALAYLRRPHDATGTEVQAGERPARVVALPFVTPSPAAP